MQDLIKVYIELCGLSGYFSGETRISIRVSRNLASAVQEIRDLLQEKQIKTPYIMYVNDIFVQKISLDEGCTVSKGDVFKIMPVFSGG
ncbi:hypothetical protein LCGC14_3145000 [marine sediment metagenome]|uniref:Ubiquitin Mut7-C domain-containing protein n=1 Tax=marine sediment metagenome TaxID=412755 RepID=A0A0F8Y2Q6_9ZZZZ|nr:MoaD/ThiS family protein [Spirochaetota bacterium]